MLTMQSSCMIMDKCPVCSKHVLQHAKQISCCICFTKFHMKCLSLKPEDHDYLQVNAATWYCVKCTSELFPFNHFVDDDTFVLEANQIDVGTKLLSHSQNLYSTHLNSMMMQTTIHLVTLTRMLTFSMSLTIIWDSIVIITLKTLFLIYWLRSFQVCLVIKYFPCVTWISEVWRLTYHHFRHAWIISNSNFLQ